MAPQKDIPPEVMRRVQLWLDDDYDQETKDLINKLIKENPQELIDSFSKDLTFGTGGMRELMGVGPNRINRYSIYRATQGLANFLHSKKPDPNRLSVVIGYDSRNNSKEFALDAARCLAGNHIKAYVTTDLRPTPFVSFACRYKKSLAAIMITASHNPKEYNGFKVYGRDGAQVVAPSDQDIIEEVKQITSLRQIRIAEDSSPYIEYLDEAVDEAYLQAIKKLQIHPRENLESGKNVKIIYTPLHGAGITLMPAALESWGFTHLTLVNEQEKPDGNFPTVLKPNPEEKAALELGIQYLQKEKGDLLIATDPDADRVGFVTMYKGEPYAFTGNQIACMCLFHILSSFRQLNLMPPNSAVVTTIVTTPLFKIIAEHFGVDCYEVLTGFKYIGQLIHKWEKGIDSHNFLFGAEESYGYLYGTHARDKDGIISGCLVAEMTSFLKEEGKSLVDFLFYLYESFGIFREDTQSIEFPPHEKNKMNQYIEEHRIRPPSEVGGLKIKSVLDLTNDKMRPPHLPKSNVLIWEFEDHSKVIIRASGTEPKLKMYGMCGGALQTDMIESIKVVDQKLSHLLAETAKLFQ